MSDDPIPLGKAIWSNGRTKPKDMIYLQSLLRAGGDLSSCTLQIRSWLRRTKEKRGKKRVYKKVEIKGKGKGKKTIQTSPQCPITLLLILASKKL